MMPYMTEKGHLAEHADDNSRWHAKDQDTSPQAGISLKELH